VLQKVPSSNRRQVEKLFRGFVVIVAGFMSLAHGANDVANSVGPFGAGVPTT
jgi:phosphate/sulfate permease